MEHKGKGGSYRREDDGSRTLIERTDWTPEKSKPKPKTSKVKGKPKTTEGGEI